MKVEEENSKKTASQQEAARRVLSLHPVIEGDAFYWDRGVWNRNVFHEISRAAAVILPQTVDREFYYLCRKLCPHVFPNYDIRFQWEGKVGDTLAFWAYGMKHPRTLVFPRVETLLGDHPQMDHQTPELPPYPFVLKGAQGGEGKQVWLIEGPDDLEKKLQTLQQFELQGCSGFVIQEYLADLERDLRVVVVGDQVFSYWRKGPGFLHNIARGGEIDDASDPDMQEWGREKVKQFCLQSRVNLAAFDLIFVPGDSDPFFLEINYTFGRKGLGGSESFYRLLRDSIERWLAAVA
jgi:ribosomal protein S6--L-glutamate ligase